MMMHRKLRVCLVEMHGWLREYTGGSASGLHDANKLTVGMTRGKCKIY